jgi:MFS family permease
MPKNKRTMGVSLHSLVRRIPMALGPVVGGILIGYYGEKDGVRLAFIGAFVLAGVSIILQQKMIVDGGRSKDKTEMNPFKSFGLISPSLRNLLVSDILIRFCEQIPYAFVVVWCVTLNGVSPLDFGVLTTVEMVTAMLVYIPVAYLADKSTKKPFVLITFGFFTIFPLVLLVSKSFWIMVIAFFIRGLKEFGEPTRKALIMDLAPEGKKASAFGMYYLSRDIIVSVAAFGGAFLWDASSSKVLFDALGFGQSALQLIGSVTSPATNFIVAFCFGLLGTVYFAIFGKDISVVKND